MKKVLRKIICTILVLVSMAQVVSAAGYTTMLEPSINAVDGEYTGEYFDFDYMDYMPYTANTGFYPTPFNKGYSVIHHNVIVMPGWEAEYFAKNSDVVDANGNEVKLGDYDSYGVYSMSFDEEFSSLYGEEYDSPSFNLTEGVDSYGYITVEKDNKGGLIDIHGNVILPCEYDVFWIRNENCFQVTKIIDGDDYKVEYVDENGEIITKTYSKSTKYVDKNGNELQVSQQENGEWTDNSYKGKYNVNPYFYAYDYGYHYYEHGNSYHNGLIVVAENENEGAKVGIVDTNDNVVVPFVYDMITPYYEDYCWVLKDGKWGIIGVNNNKLTVKVNDSELAFDQNPIIIEGRTLVPLNAIFTALGATVKWDGETYTVTAQRGNTNISLKIGSNQLFVNGTAKELDVPAIIVAGRTLVPAKAVSEAFGCNVGWDSATQTVNITE